ILEDDAVPMSFLPPAAANGDVDEESEAAYFRLCAARWASVWSALTQAAEALGQRGSWDMLLVGRHRFGEDRPIPGEHDLVDAGFSTCLHAYAVSRRGAERLLELTNLSEESPLGVVIPIDDLLPGVWTGRHPRRDVEVTQGTGLLPLPKILALCYELNVSMAVKACWLTWLVVSLLLLASAGSTSEDMRDTLGSITLSPWVFFLTVDLPLIVFFMFFFFAHGLTFEFWTPSVWFDKACINQEDQDEKEEAIAILPEILHQSSRILVLWDPTLFSRLWCNLEIATFAKSHREDPDAIRILQPWITPWLLCSLFAEWLAARVLLPWYGQRLTAEENIEWHPGSFLDYLVAGLVSNAPFVVLQLPALWISAVFFSYKLNCSADILDAFANFDVRNAQCSMSSDRRALHAQIARFSTRSKTRR
ncbi:colgalt1, partial [Symbiodinium sp. CCMP2456]